MEYARNEDIPVWLTFDRHIAQDELEHKIRLRRCYLLRYDGLTVGVLRYNLFWDSIPFLTMLYLQEEVRGKGLGTDAMRLWEMEMRFMRYPAVMTSTQADEGAQHFYRKLGYRDAGCLLLDQPPLKQPAELFFVKIL
jgi:GNAT superfamily N-acetyltransferase